MDLRPNISRMSHLLLVCSERTIFICKATQKSCGFWRSTHMFCGLESQDVDNRCDHQCTRCGVVNFLLQFDWIDSQKMHANWMLPKESAVPCHCQTRWRTDHDKTIGFEPHLLFPLKPSKHVWWAIWTFPCHIEADHRYALCQKFMQVIAPKSFFSNHLAELKLVDRTDAFDTATALSNY